MILVSIECFRALAWGRSSCGVPSLFRRQVIHRLDSCVSGRASHTCPYTASTQSTLLFGPTYVFQMSVRGGRSSSVPRNHTPRAVAIVV